MSSLPDPSVDAAIALLQAELSRIRDASVEALRGYLTWFMWFYGTQVLILAWATTKVQDRSNRWTIIVLSSIMILNDVLSLRPTLRARAFFRLQDERAAKICRSLTVYSERLGLSIEITPGFPGDLIPFAFGPFTAGLILAGAVWLYVLCYALFMNAPVG